MNNELEKIEKIKFETIRLRVLNTHMQELEKIAQKHNEMNPNEKATSNDIIVNLISNFIKSRSTN